MPSHCSHAGWVVPKQRGDATAAIIVRAWVHVRIVVVANDQPRRRIAAGADFLKAVLIGVAGGRRAALVDHAVAVVVAAIAQLPQRAARIALDAAAIRGG